MNAQESGRKNGEDFTLNVQNKEKEKENVKKVVHLQNNGLTYVYLFGIV